MSLLAGEKHFRYELKNRETGGVLGKAESSITLDHFSSGEFKGKQTVLFSGDNNAICIVEDASDALPAKRYILFRKLPSHRYAARYLHPSFDPDPSNVTFKGDYPTVIALTADRITFSSAAGASRPLPIDAVPTFPNAQTAIY